MEHAAEWLYTVCRNLALNRKRKEKRMNPLPEEKLAEATDGSPAPSAITEREESAHEALVLLARLPENQQEVVRLKFQGGLSYREISRVTNLSVTNVGFLLHSALKTLRGKLAGAAFCGERRKQ